MTDLQMRALDELRNKFAPEVDVLPMVQTREAIRRIIEMFDNDLKPDRHRRDTLRACFELAEWDEDKQEIRVATKPKHTPGPYVLTGWEQTIVNSAAGSTLALAPGNRGATLAEIKATARLFAAAPELLASLKELSEYIIQRAYGMDSPELAMLQRASDAIKKAEGE